MASRRPSPPPGPPAPQPVDLDVPVDLPPIEAGQIEPGELVEDVELSAGDSDVVDLSGCRILSARLRLTGAEEAVLRAARLSEVDIAAPDVPVLRAPYGQWRDVVVTGGRLGTAEAFDSEWTRVVFRGVRLRYLNLRSARVSDLVLEDCVIDELDLGGAELTRVALPGTRVGRLEADGVRLEAVDLRGARLETVVGARSLAGAVVGTAQLMELDPCWRQPSVSPFSTEQSSPGGLVISATGGLH